MPPIPTHLRECVGKLVGDRLPKGDWTAAQIAGIVKQLRVSEARKDQCVVELIAFYDDVAQGRGGKP